MGASLLAVTKSIYYPEEILRGGKFVKNLEMYLINSSHHIQPYSIIDEYVDLAKHTSK